MQGKNDMSASSAIEEVLKARGTKWKAWKNTGQ